MLTETYNDVDYNIAVWLIVIVYGDKISFVFFEFVMLKDVPDRYHWYFGNIIIALDCGYSLFKT